MLALAPEPLPPATEFQGAGIYAIYYAGDLEPYAEVSSPDCLVPIYVGKAVPRGARRGGNDPTEAAGNVLFARLVEHGQSISTVSNLDLNDFHCRYLVVDDVWIPLAESLLIQRFRPVWNMVLDGFGNHDPGKGRYEGMRPRWDTVHPGREWAAKCQAREETPASLIDLVKNHIKNHGPT